MNEDEIWKALETKLDGLQYSFIILSSDHRPVLAWISSEEGILRQEEATAEELEALNLSPGALLQAVSEAGADAGASCDSAGRYPAGVEVEEAIAWFLQARAEGCDPWRCTRPCIDEGGNVVRHK
jgi:hypothetical protein